MWIVKNLFPIEVIQKVFIQLYNYNYIEVFVQYGSQGNKVFVFIYYYNEAVWKQN